MARSSDTQALTNSQQKYLRRLTALSENLLRLDFLGMASEISRPPRRRYRRLGRRRAGTAALPRPLRLLDGESQRLLPFCPRSFSRKATKGKNRKNSLEPISLTIRKLTFKT